VILGIESAEKQERWEMADEISNKRVACIHERCENMVWPGLARSDKSRYLPIEGSGSSRLW
jgi:hypothetical protein